MARRTINHLNQVATRSGGGGARELVSGYELAGFLGITERRIQQLAKEGLPKAGRGMYPLRESVRFYVDYLQRLVDENSTDTIKAEKVKMFRAKRIKAEVEAKQMDGTVLDLEKTRQELMFLAVQIKDVFFSLPGRLAPSLAGLEAGQIKSKLTEAVTASLNIVADKIDEFASERGCVDNSD